MEDQNNTENTQTTNWDSLVGVFSSQEINTVKEILNITEKHLLNLNINRVREMYAEFNVKNILKLLQGSDSDNSKVLAKFENKGITGIKVGDQIVKINGKQQEKPGIIFNKIVILQ